MALNDKAHFRNLFNSRMSRDEHVKVDQQVIESYRGVLPDELLMYWEKDGWCSYNNGLFWLVNPSEYDEEMHDYLAFTPLKDRKNLYVVARSAFGELFVWERGKGNVTDISLINNSTVLLAATDRQNLSPEEEEFEMNRFIGVKEPKYLDEDDASGKPLFERALKKFGRLKSNEMYGYKLNPALGGKDSITNLDKLDLFIYANIQLQLDEPRYWISDTENNTITTF